MELCSAFSSKIEFQNVHAKEEGLFTLKKAFPVPLFPLHSIFRHSTNQNATCIVHSGTQKVQCQSIPPPPLSPLVIIIIVAVALLSATSNQRPTPPPPKEEELASPPFLIILHHHRQTREGGRVQRTSALSLEGRVHCTQEGQAASLAGLLLLFPQPSTTPHQPQALF